jgi:hypothetical protein
MVDLSRAAKADEVDFIRMTAVGFLYLGYDVALRMSAPAG